MKLLFFLQIDDITKYLEEHSVYIWFEKKTGLIVIKFSFIQLIIEPGPNYIKPVNNMPDQ